MNHIQLFESFNLTTNQWILQSCENGLIKGDIWLKPKYNKIDGSIYFNVDVLFINDTSIVFSENGKYHVYQLGNFRKSSIILRYNNIVIAEKFRSKDAKYFISKIDSEGNPVVSTVVNVEVQSMEDWNTRIERFKKKNMKNFGYDIVQVLTWEEGLKYISNSRNRNIHRLVSLGKECAICGKEATKFMIGKDNQGNLRFNMYSDDNSSFNLDHIIPRSKGGEDHPDNYQLACFSCNTKKGNTL